jgi:uncharacterized protein YndB with AHSA1/START domain
MEDAPEPPLVLTAVRRIPAPASRIWAGLTSKHLLEAWWSPSDLATRVRRLEVRLGGAVEMHVRYVPALWTAESTAAFRAAGVPISFDLRGTWSEFEVERRLTFDLTLELDRKGAGVGMRTRFDLVPEGAATGVTITGTGASTPHWRTLGQRNLEAQLERLEQAVTGSGAAAAPDSEPPGRDRKPGRRDRAGTTSGGIK